jgi:outer membrane murein-binding lipoprotein Lpp
MTKSDESQLPSPKKSAGRIEELQLRVIQLENELLVRDQASFDRLDAIAQSSEALQTHYLKAIQDQAELSSALEKSHVKTRILQQNLDLSEHQLSDLRLAHAELQSRLVKLRESWNDEANHKLEMASECIELRQQLCELDQLRSSHSSLLSTIHELNLIIDQAELRCLHQCSATGMPANHVQEMLAEAELRIAELSSSLESERAFYASSREQHHQELEGLRGSLSSAQRDYGVLLDRYQASDSQIQEKSTLIQSLSEANQLLHSDLQDLEARFGSLEQSNLALRQELEAAQHEVSESAAIAESHQRLLLANEELTMNVQALSERERDLCTQLEGLSSDHAINQQALDHQLQVVEAQRQEAENRCQLASDANQHLHSEMKDLEARFGSLEQSNLALRQELEAAQHEVSESAAIAESHQRLLLANEELTMNVQALSERERDLCTQLEALSSDYAINQKLLDQQLQLAEAQRREADNRCVLASTELEQLRLRHQFVLESIGLFRADLNDGLLGLRATLGLTPESFSSPAI